MHRVGYFQMQQYASLILRYTHLKHQYNMKKKLLNHKNRFFGKNYHKCSKNRFQNISVVWQLPKKFQYRKILVKVVVREFGSYQKISTTTTSVKFWQFIVFQQLPKKIHHSKILLKVVATSSYQKRQLPKYNSTWVRNLEQG